MAGLGLLLPGAALLAATRRRAPQGAVDSGATVISGVEASPATPAAATVISGVGDPVRSAGVPGGDPDRLQTTAALSGSRDSTRLSAPGQHRQEPPTAVAGMPEAAPDRWRDVPGWLRGTLESRLPERYTELSLVASGGMGSVMRAWDARLARPVAIKVAPPHLAGVEEYRIRFYREAQALARLQHPNIAGVHDVPEAPPGEAPIMIMEFLEGKDLSRHLEEVGPGSVPETLGWIRQAGAALQHVHEQGILHRDVKPANLFLLDSGVVKLVDFGLVAFEELTGLTMTGARMGSVAYMPPEQIRGERVGAAADQYSLAASAFQLLSGKLPFAVDDSLRLSPPRLSVSRRDSEPALDVALMRAMAPRYEDRFESVQAFLAVLPGT